jgi:hypothetical protein
MNDRIEAKLFGPTGASLKYDVSERLVDRLIATPEE